MVSIVDDGLDPGGAELAELTDGDVSEVVVARDDESAVGSCDSSSISVSS